MTAASSFARNHSYAVLDVVAVVRAHGDRRSATGGMLLSASGGRMPAAGVDAAGTESLRVTVPRVVASELTVRVADVGFFLAGCRFLNSW